VSSAKRSGEASVGFAITPATGATLPTGQERSGHLRPDLEWIDAVVGQESLDPPLDAGRLGVAGHGHGELAGPAVLDERYSEAEVGHGLGLMAVQVGQEVILNLPPPVA
jgi:hypothetical protein